MLLELKAELKGGDHTRLFYLKQKKNDYGKYGT